MIMCVVTKCVNEVVSGEPLQQTVRKYAKNSHYRVRELMKIVRWIVTPEWLKSRVGSNYKGRKNASFTSNDLLKRAWV